MFLNPAYAYFGINKSIQRHWKCIDKASIWVWNFYKKAFLGWLQPCINTLFPWWYPWGCCFPLITNSSTTTSPGLSPDHHLQLLSPQACSLITTNSSYHPQACPLITTNSSYHPRLVPWSQTAACWTWPPAAPPSTTWTSRPAPWSPL